jgi:predicted lipoprotein
MKNRNRNSKLTMLAGALCAAALLALSNGCTTTTTPGANGSTTTTKGIDPDSVALIDQAISNIVATAPAAIADAQAISALVHGANK